MWIGRQNLECVIHLLLRDATSHIEEVGRLAVVQLHDVHRCHGETSAVDQTADIAVHADVVEIVFGGLLLARVRLSLVIQREDVGLAELGVVVEVDFRVKTNNCNRIKKCAEIAKKNTKQTGTFVRVSSSE